MKLAIVIFRYFPFGGLQRDMLALAQAAQARGHAVTIFCGDWQGEKVPGIDVVVIKPSGLFNVAGVKHFVTAFLQQFPRNQFDLLLGFNKMPGLDVYFAGDSCFAHKAYAERSGMYRLAPRSRLYLAYERAVFAAECDVHILSLVESEQKQFVRYYGTPAEHFHFLPPGISAAHIACENPRHARMVLLHDLGLTTDTRIILCLGSGFKTKGVDISIAAFADLQTRVSYPVALVIVGSDDPYDYRKQAQSLGVGDQVFFLGARSPVGDLLHAADVLLHPARKELAGNVILEAMLCGCPVVASAHCGYAHYVAQQAMGQLIPAGATPVAIAAMVASVLAVDVAVWRECSEVFAKTSDVFSRVDIALQILERIANNNPIASQQQVLSTANQHVVLLDELVDVWQAQDVFSVMEQMPGKVARELRDRQTIRFEINGRGYYRKWHRGVGWKEIIKNLLQLRWPVLGATNEWNALTKLRALNIPSLIPLAYGVRGKNPARQQSFIVTRELADVIQLDHFFERHNVSFKAKRRILAQVAYMVRELHAAGINHRDLYFCHFMLKRVFLANQNAEPDIYLIDLHRAQMRMQVPERWRVKDVGGLLFSALNLQFTRRDYLYFLQIYFAQDLRSLLKEQKSMLEKITARAIKMYRRDFGHAPQYFGVKK
ncbi:lipopolysaccharide core heptose(I) kinase RfaP [Cellvibrio sp. UBA7661]|uniref:lipopolysaccharide core heptose(I) kinase RfaP n=1 Tax=Cellvibrio sp. UBA7661 TaxID=1946311 RepID=UPI002F35ACBE